MKIIYISHLHPPKHAVLKNIGGMQRVSMQLAEQLEADEHTELFEYTQETGWKNIVFKTTLFLIRLFLFLPRYVKKHDADLVLFSSMVSGSVSHFVRRRVKVPMVTISHGHDVTLDVSLYQWLVPKIFKAVDAVISVSSATQQECINRGLDPAKSKVLPNGFDIKSLENVVSKKEALSVLEETFVFKLGDRKLLLTVGRLIKRKGHEWFIREILPVLKSDVVYLIVGDGGESMNIDSAIEESDMKDSILKVGRQPDELLDYAYSAADLFIMPNIKVPGDMEGFGVVLLEANIRKTPAIASNLEGIKDVIDNGKNGYRIPEGDAGAFAAKIDEVIKNELQTLSESARSHVETRFTWQRVGWDYIAFLKSLIKD